MSTFRNGVRTVASVLVILWLPALAIAADAAANAPEMVRIPGKNYEIGKYEVSQAEWRTVMGDNPSYFGKCGDTCPVERVSWGDVQEFIRKLNARTHKHYRLPTKAEWEYACYGSNRGTYCGGDDLNELGWFEGNSDGKTHLAGQKQANGYGLYDMSGNVFEWMDDCYEGNCMKRVLGGGAWSNNAQLALPSFSGGVDTTFRGSNFGFRLARTLP
jgi:formylglycine-generating enzyme required for sulfatase activity